jgi:hypothetical protein
MDAILRGKINRYLGDRGLSTLDNPGALVQQLGYYVHDHDHFRQLLTQCEPAARSAMYDALSPHLRFEAKPLEDYMIAAKEMAEREQLPQWDAKTQTFAPYKPPEIRTVEAAVAEAVAKYALTVTCRKCTRSESFYATSKYDAVRTAREAGWVYMDEGQQSYEICPDCPVSRRVS